MAVVLICAECGGEIGQAEVDEMGSRLFHADTDRPHHWACLQEAYERERLADEAERADDGY